MKILAVSDRVEKSIYSPTIKDRFGDIDLVLACGDLPPNYLEFIVSMLDVPLLYVFGNHDQGIHMADGQFKTAPAGCRNIDGQVVEVKGLLIAGLEGSPFYSRRASHQYTEWQMRWKAWRMTPALWGNRLLHGRFLDILITHTPPYCIHDGTDRCHTGFQTFRWMMERYRPRYLIHGHQHVYDLDTPIRATYLRTQVLNAYNYQVIHWDQDEAASGVGPG